MVKYWVFVPESMSILKTSLLPCCSLHNNIDDDGSDDGMTSFNLNQILKQLIFMFASRVLGVVNVIKNLLDWILCTLVNVGNSLYLLYSLYLFFSGSILQLNLYWIKFAWYTGLSLKSKYFLKLFSFSFLFLYNFKFPILQCDCILSEKLELILSDCTLPIFKVIVGSFSASVM